MFLGGESFRLLRLGERVCEWMIESEGGKWNGKWEGGGKGRGEGRVGELVGRGKGEERGRNREGRVGKSREEKREEGSGRKKKKNPRFGKIKKNKNIEREEKECEKGFKKTSEPIFSPRNPPTPPKKNPLPEPRMFLFLPPFPFSPQNSKVIESDK